ncbi:MAG: glycoside hydrolase family 15 protein [Trueperaceae bacterium]
MSDIRADVRRLVEGQAPSGAFPAGAGFSQYGQSWLRDGAFIAHALDLAGEHDSAARFHAWVAASLLPLEGHVQGLIRARAAGEPLSEFEFLPARFAVSGEWVRDGWPNFQLDGYGQWLWSLAAHTRTAGQDRLPSPVLRTVELVVRYLAAFWNEPCYDSWEEHRSQLHTATLASLAAGLRDIAQVVPAVAAEAGAVSQAVTAFIFEECVADGAFVKYVRNPAVDASLLWLATPFEVVGVSDPRMVATVARIERELLGAGLRRYAADTYYGGGEWVLLTAWLAWHWRRAGRAAGAEALLEWVEAQRGVDGGLPEQVPGANSHPFFLEHWTNTWGPSAKPLLWSHAMLVVARLAD